MSADRMHAIRGYRPSQFGCPDEVKEEAERARLANLEAYAKRVSLGLPIFEESVPPPSPRPKRA